MSEQSYWARKTMSRRTALRGVAIGGGGLAAFSLVGCGGGDDDGKPTTTTAPAVLDSTKGKPGGTLKQTIQGYPANLDTVTTSQSNNATGFVYGALLGHSYGTDGRDPNDFFSYEPEVAQALPEQPDETTFVFKIRPNNKFSNGRTITSEDVKYTFDRLLTLDRSLYKATLSTWMDRVEAPDAQTAIFRTKFPYADTLVTFAGSVYGFILAKEHVEGPDAENKMVGSGPYLLEDTQRPIGFKFKRNPDYHQKPYPYFDTIETYVAPDAVKRMADFTTRQVHLTYEHSPTERDEIKKLRPDAKSQTYEYLGGSAIMRSDKPPFNDKRVRQALSMALDRKKLREATSNGEGRPDQAFSITYQSLLGFREPKDLGAAAKYWDYNPAEAKKLLAAAGVSQLIESQMTHYDASVQGQWFVDLAILMQSQWREQGLANVKDNTVTQAQSSATILVGNYDGMGLQPSGFSGAPAFALVLRDQYYWGPNGERPNTNVNWINHPQLTQLAEKQLRQLKIEDRKATYRQMEEIVAEEQYRLATNTSIKTVFWDPTVQNVSIPTLFSAARRYQMKWWFA